MCCIREARNMYYICWCVWCVCNPYVCIHFINTFAIGVSWSVFWHLCWHIVACLNTLTLPLILCFQLRFQEVSSSFFHQFQTIHQINNWINVELIQIMSIRDFEISPLTMKYYEMSALGPKHEICYPKSSQIVNYYTQVTNNCPHYH